MTIKKNGCGTAPGNLVFFSNAIKQFLLCKLSPGPSFEVSCNDEPSHIIVKNITTMRYKAVLPNPPTSPILDTGQPTFFHPFSPLPSCQPRVRGQCATVFHKYDNDKRASKHWRSYVDKTEARLVPVRCTQCSPNSWCAQSVQFCSVCPKHMCSFKVIVYSIKYDMYTNC